MAREDYPELTPLLHGCQDGMLRFLPLILDSKAEAGVVIAVNPRAEYATTYIYTGVALDPNSYLLGRESHVQ